MNGFFGGSMNKGSFDSIIGRIVVEDDGCFVKRVYIDNAFCEAENSSELFKFTKKQLNEYLSGKRKTFDIPLKPEGTEFQRAVWNELCKIPYGRTASYKEIAEAIGKHKAARAVGGANNKNPVMIIIPCHRVVGSNGSLTGYAFGIDIKEKLLNIECIKQEPF